MAKISVIIPVYNAEKYLPRCLDSAINQTLQDIEIICVNDCSSDNSLSILEEYAKSDSRIKIINREKNGGISVARNTGMKNATGEYVGFMDNDDWIDNDYLEKMYKAAVENDVDIVHNPNVVIHFLKSDITQDLNKHSFEMDLEHYQKLSDSTNEGWLDARENISKLSWNCWQNIYKKAFLDEVGAEFPQGCFSEDVYFQYVTFVFVPQIFVIKNTAYHHDRRPDSTTFAVLKNNSFEHNLKVMNKVFDFYKANDLYNRYNIKMFWIDFALTENPSGQRDYIERVKMYFQKIEDCVQNRRYLYGITELEFFDDLMTGVTKSPGAYYTKKLFEEFRNKHKLNKAGVQ